VPLKIFCRRGSHSFLPFLPNPAKPIIFSSIYQPSTKLSSSQSSSSSIAESGKILIFLESSLISRLKSSFSLHSVSNWLRSSSRLFI
jgi:hypothetical protein